MRKKMRMHLDELQVESYPTTAARFLNKGTVHGQAAATLDVCSGYATCLSACSATDGVFICKTCGRCC
jgi:hypothetical protein